ncbi:MAG TPA: hypothetical protein VF540_06470 [Segetibacter sp.]|jgi:peptidoglycan hydrolase CwlO-like protein
MLKTFLAAIIAMITIVSCSSGSSKTETTGDSAVDRQAAPDSVIMDTADPRPIVKPT